MQLSGIARALILALAIVGHRAVRANDDDEPTRFNQSSMFKIEVLTENWSNYDEENGGCVTCPYTCVKPQTGPTGTSLNLTDPSELGQIPPAYFQQRRNGCCYAPKTESTVMPDCSNEANPPKAEPCGFLFGPTLKWYISDAFRAPEKPYRAILFASIDCENFWAVGQTPVKYTDKGSKVVDQKKQINGGCYGDPTGKPMILAGCLTAELKFDKSKTYPWDQLAAKCSGLSGKCVITNGIWGEHLECCTKRTGLLSDWDLSFKEYHQKPKVAVHLSGPAITGIVFGGVGLLMCLVHYGAKVRERARQTALMREQEATDDYEEIMTPLTAGERKPAPLQRPIGPSSVEVSLHEGDKIYRKPEEELLYEGDMY